MKRRIIYATLLAIFAAVGTQAQNLNGAYFMDGWAAGHEMNPAKDYDCKGYLAFPVLGNLNVGVKGNFSLKDFLYKNPNGSGLVTYLHPDIPVSKALDGFGTKNKLNFDVRVDIISLGFHAFNGYNTFVVSSRTHAGVNVPGELFRLTKNLENKNYKLKKTSASASSWIEIGLGHSHQVSDAWRVGGKFKFLLGVGYARMDVDNLKLDLSAEDRWVATGNATAEVGVMNFDWGETKTRNYANQYPGHTTYEEIDFDNTDVDKFGLNGAGIAVDLGAEWDLGKQELVEGMKISASLLDLGFIKWDNVATAYNNGEEFQFNGFNDVKIKDGNGVEMETQTDDLEDRLNDLYSLRKGENTSKTRGIGATLNLGLEYELPSYDKLSFGFLSTTRMQGAYSWNEERVSATVSPVKWFEASVSLATGTIGTNIGWVINLHPKGFNLFLGSDHSLVKLSKQFVPLKSTYDFNFGIAFPFGNKKS